MKIRFALYRLFVFLLLSVAMSASAATDTLNKIGEKSNKGDTSFYTNILHKFEWQVNIKNAAGHSGPYLTRRPDSLFEDGRIDTVFMSTSFLVGPALLNKMLILHYELDGSVLIRQNGETIAVTGRFLSDYVSGQSLLIQNVYKDIIFTDTLQRLEIIYLPYPHTGMFNFNLKIDAYQVGDAARNDIARDKIESAGMGFYYLAFGIVFLILFLFFREKTENLYFALFCIFAALSFLWEMWEFPFRVFKTDVLYNLDYFFSIFCFEFLSIFFYKVLRNKEKSKLPLMIISGIMVVCFLPVIRYHYDSFFNNAVPLVLLSIFSMLYLYAWGSALYFLIAGVWQKKWEARAVLITCFIPIALFVLLLIVFIVVSAVNGSDNDVNVFFNMLLNKFTKSIVYVYPLAAVFILGRRNGLNQLKLIAQVRSIQQLSEENLAKEVEKKHILESQKESLEKEVSLRTAEIVAQKDEIEKQHGELKVEKKKSDDLLRNILPEEVAEELKEKGFSEARHFDNVTVLFADFVDFTKAGEAMTPQQLVSELHICFKSFDEIISKYGIEKIKTIGDAYLAVCGLPVSDPAHAGKVVQAALEINEFMVQRKAQLGEKVFQVRIGIHSGSVVAGIVGVKKFAYDIWGDTVNTAARMEQNSEPGKLNISQTTYDLVKDKFTCEYRGEIEAKNKGKLKMYFVSK